MIKDKVSIIVPVFNAERYLERTIEYLRNQTYENIEIILVDDGSTDSSPQICDKACKEDERIKCIHKQNAGVSAARNDGMKASTGKYIMFCDADDIPSLQMTEHLLKKAKAENADIVLCGFKKQIGESVIDVNVPYTDTMTSKPEMIQKLIMPMIVWSYAPEGIVFPDIYGSVCRGLYKKELLKNKMILFPTTISLGEDMVFNVSVFFASAKVSFLNENLYTYIENLYSATHTNGSKLWGKYLETWRCVHQISTDNEFDSNDVLWHNYQLSRYAVSAILEGICPQDNSKEQKQVMVKNILNDSYLAETVRSLPKNISLKNKLICFLIKNKRFKILSTYYQHIYNKSI